MDMHTQSLVQELETLEGAGCFKAEYKPIPDATAPASIDKGVDMGIPYQFWTLFLISQRPETLQQRQRRGEESIWVGEESITGPKKEKANSYKLGRVPDPFNR